MQSSFGRRSALAGVAAMLAAPAPAQQPPYPNRPIRFIVPFPPGASTDTQARLLGDRLSAIWGQPIVIDNRGGGNGIVGAEAVARAAPDGYTVLFTANTTHSSNPAMYRRLPYDPVADFEPVALLGTGQLLLIVNNALPVRTARELIAYARAHPGQLNFASGSASGRAAGELFKRMAGIDMVNVTYRGTPPAITDVIAGTAQLMFADITNAVPLVREGRVRPLGVTARQRFRVLPDVPTVEEASGLDGYEMLTWIGAFAPAGVPQAILDELNARFNEVMAGADIQQRLEGAGLRVQRISRQAFATYLAADIEKWRKIVREADIEVL